EFDSAASFPEDARYTTAATVDNVIDFYRNELPKFGWQLAKGPEVIPSHIELEFVQKAMKLVLRIANNAKKKKVDVHIQSWVVGEPAASVDKSKSSGSQPKTRGDRPKAAGPRPKELPLPDDGEDIGFNASARRRGSRA